MATRAGNEFWQFDATVKGRCGVCEGSGMANRTEACQYCGGAGTGRFSYDWDAILVRAAAIVDSYEDTGVTLRQLFYRLVAGLMLPNTKQAYGSLSSNSARARREGWFPRLVDNGRSVDTPQTWDSPDEAALWLAQRYRERRGRDQEYNVFLGVEKNGLKAQLWSWFAGTGASIFACGGYPSQSLADEIADQIRSDKREAVLIYAGDFDADGEDIPRDLVQRVEVFDHVQRVALTPAQVQEFALPPQPGKWASARAKGFADKYGDLFMDTYGVDLVQIELDAIPPTDLKQIYSEALWSWYDRDIHRDALAVEEGHRAEVKAWVEGK